MKVSNNFSIQEFVPKPIFDRFGNNSIWFIRKELISLAQGFRDHFGVPMTINNWHSGGTFQNRGFRSPDASIGGALSQHKFGAAIDFNLAGLTSKQIYDEIMKNEKKFMSLGLTTLENTAFTKTWIHADMRNTGLSKILIVNP